MREFEKYIKTQKDTMDTDEFGIEIWESIEGKLPKKESKIRYMRWIYTAVATVLLAFFIKDYSFSSSKSPVEFLTENGIDSKALVLQLDKKIAALHYIEVPVEQKKDFEIIIQQLKILDQEYHRYLEHLEQNGYQESIGKRIINYYKTKIELLDKIQQQIEKINYYETKYNKKSKKVGITI